MQQLQRVLAVSVVCVSFGCRADATSKAREVRELAPSQSDRAGAGPEGLSEAQALEQSLREMRKEIAELPSLSSVRNGLKTALVRQGEKAGPAPTPPEDGPFELITYAAEPGPLAAYLSKDPGDGERHPAIIWLTGGDTNSIGDVWTGEDPRNDQSASAYRDAGLVMMFPSQRGGNDNPGRREGFFGEIDDVLAAHAHLASLPYVDPARIYLGGHSTGGTLALLVTETRDVFRATFAFGPVADIAGYGGEYVYCDMENEGEMSLRSPMFWLASIRTPTFVFEGSDGNADSLGFLSEVNTNPLVAFHELEGAGHFDVLGPVNTLIATKLLEDVGPTAKIAFGPELQQLFD